MNARKRPNQEHVEKVLHLNDFRDIENQPLAAALQAKQDRIDLVHDHITRHLNNPDAPVVAAAMVYLDSNGRIGVAAAGIEPEMTDPFSHELREVAQIVERHNVARRRRNSGQRGIASLLTVTTIGFVAASYINEIAWVDAALTLVGQLIAAYLTERVGN